jgi:hypothetical protein
MVRYSTLALGGILLLRALEYTSVSLQRYVNQYNKMTVKQLRQEISINVRGLAKLKKIQLVEILKQNQ